MLATGTELKLFDFFFFGGGGGIFITLTGFCLEMKRYFFLFWHFSVRYNVSFTKIICISMPHRLNVFSHIFHEILFPCI